jgi:hypothetical protein
MIKNNKQVHTETLIDVFIRNGDLIHDSKVVGCPYSSFSDRCFVISNFNVVRASYEL